jgi:hypothetical protein
MPAFKNITGLRFGRLVALEREGRNRWGNTNWLCRCDCGEPKSVSSKLLITGRTSSCGCLRLDRISTHRQSRTRTYVAWQSMHARCGNPKHHVFKRYGGRGIKDRYPSFEAFVVDMGECPPGHDLHRLDNDGDYEPGNCVWFSHSEHMRLHARRRKALFPPLLSATSQS